MKKIDLVKIKNLLTKVESIKERGVLVRHIQVSETKSKVVIRPLLKGSFN